MHPMTLRGIARRCAASLGALALASALLAAGCASIDSPTKVAQTWKDPAYRGGPLGKVFVISLAETQMGGRAAVEDAIVAQFKAVGVEAVASHSALASDDAHPEPNLVEAIRTSGANGVLLAQIKQVTSSEPYMNPYQTMTSPDPDIGGYFDLFQSQGANQPNTYKTARVDTRVYAVPGGKQVWGAYSDSYDAVSFSRSMPGYTTTLMVALERDGMIRRMPEGRNK
jgi:hypothetical protein